MWEGVGAGCEVCGCWGGGGEGWGGGEGGGEEDEVGGEGGMCLFMGLLGGEG